MAARLQSTLPSHALEAGVGVGVGVGVEVEGTDMATGMGAEAEEDGELGVENVSNAASGYASVLHLFYISASCSD